MKYFEDIDERELRPSFSEIAIVRFRHFVSALGWEQEEALRKVLSEHGEAMVIEYEITGDHRDDFDDLERRIMAEYGIKSRYGHEQEPSEDFDTLEYDF